MLKDGKVATRIPVQDLQRARTFYAEKLGLEPSEERPGGLLYRCGGNIATMSATHRPTPVVGLDWRQVWPCAMLPLPRNGPEYPRRVGARGNRRWRSRYAVGPTRLLRLLPAMSFPPSLRRVPVVGGEACHKPGTAVSLPALIDRPHRSAALAAHIRREVSGEVCSRALGKWIPPSAVTAMLRRVREQVWTVINRSIYLETDWSIYYQGESS